MSSKQHSRDSKDGKEKNAKKRSPVYEAVNMIVESIQGVVEISKNIEFKQKCLNIIDADDYAELNHKTRRKLTKLLKYRYRGLKTPVTQNKDMEESNPIQREISSPIKSPIHHKRKHREPLTSSPNNPLKKRNSLSDHFSSGSVNRNTDIELHQNSPAISDNVNKQRTDIDMSLLCNFVNGVNDGLDKWFDESSNVVNGNDVLVNDVSNEASSLSSNVCYEDTWLHLSEMSDVQKTLDVNILPNNSTASLISLNETPQNTQDVTISGKCSVVSLEGALDEQLNDDNHVSTFNDSSQTVPDGNRVMYEHLSQEENIDDGFWNQASPWKDTKVKEKDPFDLSASDLFRICDEDDISFKCT